MNAGRCSSESACRQWQIRIRLTKSCNSSGMSLRHGPGTICRRCCPILTRCRCLRGRKSNECTGPRPRGFAGPHTLYSRFSGNPGQLEREDWSPRMDQRRPVTPADCGSAFRDDDTNFFTTPEELERAYGRITECGPVSLAVVPFCRAGTSKAVPEKLRRTWSVHPLHENGRWLTTCAKRCLRVDSRSCCTGITTTSRTIGRSLQMATTSTTRVRRGASDTLKSCSPRRSGCSCRRITQSGATVFAPLPARAFTLPELRAFAEGGLCYRRGHGHCGGSFAGGGPSGGLGVPWILDLGDHREIAGNAVTPLATLKSSQMAFDRASDVGGVFCAATHYWELDVPSQHAGRSDRRRASSRSDRPGLEPARDGVGVGGRYGLRKPEPWGHEGKRMKIAVVDERVYGYASGDPLVAGGAERYVWLLTRALVASGWSATVGVRTALKPGERVRIDGVEFVGIGRGPVSCGVVPILRFRTARLVPLVLRLSTFWDPLSRSEG